MTTIKLSTDDYLYALDAIASAWANETVLGQQGERVIVGAIKYAEYRKQSR